jgi:hypothetical protein
MIVAMSITDDDLLALSRAELARYDRDGYHIARGMFDASEIAALRARFDAIAEAGAPIPGHWEPAGEASADPLASLWRRSFICHYMPRSAKQIAEWYFPLHDLEGNVVEYAKADGGGPCGEEYDWSRSEKWH